MSSLLDEAASLFHEDMIRLVDRLPTSAVECRRVRDLQLLENSEITDEHLKIIQYCPHLETVVFQSVPTLSDRTLVMLAASALNLQSIDITDCQLVTDVGLLELTNKSLPLQKVVLNGAQGCRDPSISALAKACPHLVELELCRLPMLSPLSIRDVFSFSRKLRSLRLGHCPLLSDKAFPSSLGPNLIIEDDEKPLPPRPTTWLDELPPLILRHTAENLRVLDLAFCKITDDAVHGIVAHAPKIQTLVLNGCSALTDQAIDSICLLGDSLDIVLLAQVSNITDAGIIKLSRSCTNLRCVDVSFCRNLTDMSVFELAALNSIRRLAAVRVKLTDLAIFALAEHSTGLERLQLSYCDKISLEAIHLLLNKLARLEELKLTGVKALKRKGVARFSDAPPPATDEAQQSMYRVFTGQNIDGLRRFLDKEESRRRESEAKNIPFISRSDDKLDLY
ncbi:hypothetical protein C8J56DRAFT_824725 [Mycena floridula]|nr:hypothetical protein C8J56DRAFT_824725 [Mycena floridula]